MRRARNGVEHDAQRPRALDQRIVHLLLGLLRRRSLVVGRPRLEALDDLVPNAEEAEQDAGVVCNKARARGIALAAAAGLQLRHNGGEVKVEGCARVVKDRGRDAAASREAGQHAGWAGSATGVGRGIYCLCGKSWHIGF